MEYNVVMTEHAAAQLRESIQYIAHTLQAPIAAKAWTARMRKEIASLDMMPRRFPLTDENPWHTRGVRKMAVENFLVYYAVDDEALTVLILGIVYGRRDQLQALRHVPEF